MRFGTIPHLTRWWSASESFYLHFDVVFDNSAEKLTFLRKMDRGDYDDEAEAGINVKRYVESKRSRCRTTRITPFELGYDLSKTRHGAIIVNIATRSWIESGRFPALSLEPGFSCEPTIAIDINWKPFKPSSEEEKPFESPFKRIENGQGKTIEELEKEWEELTGEN